MHVVFEQLTLVDIHQDVSRNIVSLCESQDLFDDLTQDSTEWLLAHRVEEEVKPLTYRSRTPIIDRPFEDAEWFSAITWPFENWRSSRFSDGSYGVWYGSESVETTVYESVFHWYKGLLSDAGFDRAGVIAERKVYKVACAAALLDFRKLVDAHTDLRHRTDYTFCQSVGSRIHREGHPGLLMQSVRRPQGENMAIFNPNILSNPRDYCQLRYRLEATQVVVEKCPGGAWFSIALDAFS